MCLSTDSRPWCVHMSIIFFLFYNPMCVPWISIRGTSRLVFVSDVGGDACGGVRLCDQPENQHQCNMHWAPIPKRNTSLYSEL